MIHKLPFGFRDNRLFEINEVEAGLKCDCVCPSCGSKLIARKGKVKMHHFAHHNAPECRYALESALHHAAKQILFEEGKINIPAYKKLIDEKFINEVFGNQQVLIIEDSYFHTIFKERMIKIENVELEKRFHDFVPDIILQSNGQTLIVEIAVTHFIDDNKKEKIRKAGVSVIEIDLSEYKGVLDFDLLRNVLVKETKHKRWTYNNKGDMLWNAEKQRLQMENDNAIADFHLSQSKLAVAIKEGNHKVAHELQSQKNFIKPTIKKY